MENYQLAQSLNRTTTKRSTQSTSVTTLNEISLTRAVLVEYLKLFGSDRDHLLTELNSIQKNHKNVGKMLAEEVEPSYLEWVNGLAPIGDSEYPIPIIAKAGDGSEYTIPAHLAVPNSAKYLLECLYTLPNILFFGEITKNKKGEERRKHNLAANPAKGHLGSVVTGSDAAGNWGLRMQPTYLVQSGKSGDKLYKGIELIASLTTAIVTGSEDKERIKNALTGDAGDTRFQWPIEFIQHLCFIRFRGLLYAGIRELVAKIKNDLDTQTKLDKFIESEIAQIPEEFTAPLANAKRAIESLKPVAQIEA